MLGVSNTDHTFIYTPVHLSHGWVTFVLDQYKLDWTGKWMVRNLTSKKLCIVHCVHIYTGLVKHPA